MNPNQKIVLEILESNDIEESFEKLINLIKNKKTSFDLKREVALGLIEIDNQQAVPVLVDLIKSIDTVKANSFLFVLSHFDCSDYLKEIITVGLDGNQESYQHINDILFNVSDLSAQDKKILLASLNLKKEISMNENIVNIQNINFLNHCIEIINLIEEKLKPVKAKIIPFKLK